MDSFNLSILPPPNTRCNNQILTAGSLLGENYVVWGWQLKMPTSEVPEVI